MTEDENFPEARRPGSGLIGPILLSVGVLVCLLATMESMNGLPFEMPRSWYIDRELWIGAAIVAIVAGFLIQRPPRGDEHDTN